MFLLHKWRIFTITVLTGVMISISFYLFPVEGGAFHPSRSVSSVMWPLNFLLASFQLFPRLFVARIIWEALGGPQFLGHAFAFLYWPIIGAFVGFTKHYLLLGIGIVLIHVALTGLILYFLSKATFTP
jgi:hypothetical protein